jgi:hypothetical protein
MDSVRSQLTVYNFKFLKNTKKTREKFKRSGEKSFPNINRLLHLNLNFIKFIEMDPNAH